MLKAKNISYRAGKKQILHDCSLDIIPGAFTAVIGPNGAGKSTLLKALSNELGKNSGQVKVNGVDTQQLKSRELSQIRAVMPQHTGINFPFTIEQVIEIGRFAHDTNPVENARIIEEVIQRSKLDSYRGRIYQTLSGGEKQRVQLARVMAQMWDKSPYPKYLLLDEPTSDLDLLHQHSLLGISRDLLERNMGVLAILHDLNLAAQYADYLIFMKEGRILEHGPTELVFTKDNIETTFDHPVELIKEPRTGRTVVISIPKHLEHQNQKEVLCATS